MALNYRRPKKLTSENPTTSLITGKTANILQKDTALTKRKALGEIKNQVSNRETQTKRNVPVVKPQVKLIKSVSLNPKTTEESESIAQKTEISTKFETECKIQEVSKPKSYSSQRFDALEGELLGNDPHFVPEYINDIYAYLRSLEVQYAIDPLFLSSSRTTNRMRSVLVNWLVEVQINFKMLTETLHLCVAIIDRYLQKNKNIGRENLQLVGITALWVAGKYEEMYLNEIKDFVYISDNTVTEKEIMKMELSIIKTLDYSFGRPLSLHFLRRYSRLVNVQIQEHTLAKYLLELALLEIELCYLKPSLQAAAALYLAMSVYSEGTGSNKIWTKVLVHYSTYNFTDIEKTVKLMAEAVVKAETSKYQAIRTKYAASSNLKVSLIPELKGPVIRKFAQK